MEHPLNSGSPRIEVVDALRGFAVMAIMLLHNIEHFNFYSFPEASSAFMQALDKSIWDTLFFLFGGKAYAIFALLFGFSFYIQMNNQEKKGKDFRLRFMWRQVLLFFIGCVNAAFFPGEILVLYSLVGFVLVPFCKLKNKVVLAIAIFLMLQPLEWGKFFYALFNSEYIRGEELWRIHAEKMYPFLAGSDFWSMVKSNLWDGQWFSILWAWDYGRICQTASLFMLGMLIGRKGLFHSLKEHDRFWKSVLLFALICFVPLYYMTNTIPGLWENKMMSASMNTILSSLRNFSFMAILVASFVYLWQWLPVYKVLCKLASYGKMSLTNYLTQSMIGSFIYYGYGLSLYDDLGITVSFGVGIVLFLLQISFCHWWLRRYRQGPFEKMWRKATWVGV
ncbi:MAG: DUF418 domain-containing protein [Massilibacteroides sp.]|nr:DUF418 domain-containing protein [Massilibacteroides sp.]MDD3062564.1 DUF418 domain-containing protein [Massilibacteroides sp.]MDD4115124.1 DUF418 domain-containing protein [Massilibacteroides sp.]MDD4659344.1 DUF418 domain-containing protein [Massilibacteroides sp.]